MYMPNKTIYVSDKDLSLFDRAQEIAGEALSSVIALALREYVSRNEAKGKGMREIAVKVGQASSQREQRFIGQELGKWSGFSDDKVWLQEAKIYRTQKGNWAVYFKTNSKATLLTNPQEWKLSGDYLIDSQQCELIVAEELAELEKKLPKALYTVIKDLAKKEENPVEYLDI
jgi:EXLDI family protein